MMLKKKNLYSEWLHYKINRFKSRSTRAEKKRNKQGMLVNNVEKSNQKIFNQYLSKNFFKTENGKGTLIT